MQDGERATDWYFRVGSKFVKALEEHLVESKAKDCIVDREGRQIACHRGTGYAISVKKPILHFAMPGEIEMMSFDLEIGYEPKEDDDEYGSRHDRDIERAERIHYPADLELNFTKAKFDLWIQETRTKMRQERARPELRLLEKLLKKHPEGAREMILKLKPSDS
jgi:hypothetical protein